MWSAFGAISGVLPPFVPYHVPGLLHMRRVNRMITLENVRPTITHYTRATSDSRYRLASPPLWRRRPSTSKYYTICVLTIVSGLLEVAAEIISQRRAGREIFTVPRNRRAALAPGITTSVQQLCKLYVLHFFAQRLPTARLLSRVVTHRVVGPRVDQLAFMFWTAGTR